MCDLLFSRIEHINHVTADLSNPRSLLAARLLHLFVSFFYGSLIFFKSCLFIFLSFLVFQFHYHHDFAFFSLIYLLFFILLYYDYCYNDNEKILERNIQEDITTNPIQTRYSRTKILKNC